MMTVHFTGTVTLGLKIELFGARIAEFSSDEGIIIPDRDVGACYVSGSDAWTVIRDVGLLLILLSSYLYELIDLWGSNVSIIFDAAVDYSIEMMDVSLSSCLHCWKCSVRLETKSCSTEHQIVLSPT
jgi:hypothetical protein